MQWLRGAIPAIILLVWASLPSCGSGFSAGSAPKEQQHKDPDTSSAGGDASGGAPGSGGDPATGSGGGGAGTGGNSAGAGGRGAGGTGQGGTQGGHPGTSGRGGATGGRPSGGAGGTPTPGSGGAESGGGMSTIRDAGKDATPEPSAIPTKGLILWLRADRGVTVKSGLVTSWADQSPSGAVALQDQDDLKPILVANGLNGLPAIQFNDDYMQLGAGYSDFSFGLSMFSVAAPNDVNSCMGIFEASTGWEINDISFDSDFGKFNYEVQDESHEDVAFPQGLAQLFSVVHDTNQTVTIDRNGMLGETVQMMLPALVARTEVYVGRTLYSGCAGFKGRISEFILYSRALGDAEVAAVDKYLQTKYSCCTQ